MKRVAILLFSLLFASALSVPCNQDYECGNMPYTKCASDCQGLSNGIVVKDGLVYYLQLCSSTGSPSGANYTFKRVSINGGLPVSFSTRYQITAIANPASIVDKIGEELFFTIAYRAPGLSLLTLDDPNIGIYKNTEKDFKGGWSYDALSDRTFIVNTFFQPSTVYEIRRFDGIIGHTTSNASVYVLPSPGIDGSIIKTVRAVGSYIYFSVITSLPASTIYQGSPNCNACDYSTATPIFTANQKILDFDIVGTRIYYSTPNGIFAVNFDGSNPVTLVSRSSFLFDLKVSGDYVFYNDFNSVHRVGINGGGDMNLVQVQYTGTCRCVSRFTGPSCTDCNGQTQWFNGEPSCVPFGGDGNPLSCNYDYHCVHQPFEECSQHSCKCKAGFAGASCNQCADSSKSIVWSNGTPSCL